MHSLIISNKDAHLTYLCLREIWFHHYKEIDSSVKALNQFVWVAVLLSLYYVQQVQGSVVLHSYRWKLIKN